MHTEQLFPAVCFWKNLTSVKALIFILQLNNLSNKIFFAFLGFHKWSHTHTFLSHCRVFGHAFLLSLTYGCCCCYSKSFELGFIRPTRGATMMIVEIDSPTFPLIMFIIRGKSRKVKVSQSPLEESRKQSWPRRTRFKQIFCSSRNDSSYKKCSIALFIVASISAWFDKRCLSLPPYCIPHQCHQYSSVTRRCHNRPIRGYTGIQYTGTTLC